MKKVFGLLAIVLALFTFTACSDDEMDEIDAGKFYFELKNVSKESWVLGYDLNSVPDVKIVPENYHYGEELLLNPEKSQKGAYTESALRQSDSFRGISDKSFAVELICIAGQKKEKSFYVGEYMQFVPIQGSYGKKPLIIEWNGKEFKWAK
ncbi:MAG: hypothetical protein RBT41_11090 [Clostridia bacterium]|jgi:hypothetical protein|nr:hypothetical protein [Clostridia bacterium]